MRARIWMSIFLLLIIYLIFKPGDFEIYLENTQEKFSKDLSHINTMVDIKNLEKKYKKLISEYLSKNENYKYDKNILNSFLRKIHKQAYARKEIIRHKECIHAFNQIKNLQIDSNNSHISTLYIERKKLVEYTCKELPSAEQLIHDKITQSLKKLNNNYRNKLKSIETLDELLELHNEYKITVNKYEKQVGNNAINLVTNFYKIFIDFSNKRKNEIQKQTCQEIIKEEKRYSKSVMASLNKIDIDTIKSVVFRFNQFHNA